MERELIISLMKGRAAIYSYFSMLLAGPPESQFLGLSGQFLPAFRELGEDAAPGVEMLQAYAEKEAGMTPEKVLNTLATNYTTYFYVGHGCIPSSESVYLSSSRDLKQEPWEKVVEFYHIRKYKQPEHIREPEDHISIELHFMKYMCGLCIYMLENGLYGNLPAAIEEQKRFLDEHLLKWVPFLSKAMLRLKKFDELGLLTATAYLLPVFLESDAELLSGLLAQSVIG